MLFDILKMMSFFLSLSLAVCLIAVGCSSDEFSGRKILILGEKECVMAFLIFRHCKYSPPPLSA